MYSCMVVNMKYKLKKSNFRLSQRATINLTTYQLSVS